MIQVFAGIIFSFLIAYFLLPLVIRIAHDNQLYDIPDERKIHNQKVSSLGGIAIFTGIIISLLLVSDFSSYNYELQYFIAGFFIIFILGLIDDIFFLKAWKKILGQLFVTGMLTIKGHLLITNFYGFLGIHELTHIESIYASSFTILLLINSFNLIDGVDGLAGSLGLTAFLMFGTLFFINHNMEYAVISFTICGALLAFLMYNFSPAKIFMGDSGSTLLGLISAILAIKFIEDPGIKQYFNNQSLPAIAFGILLLPLLDVLRVFAIRISKKQSPFSPDRNHFHHLLQNKGLSHSGITITMVTIQFLIVAITLLLHNLDMHILLAIQFTLYFSSVYFLKKYIPIRKKLHIVRDKMPELKMDNIKVYPIFHTKEKVSVGEDS